MLQTDEPRRPPEKDQGALWLELLQRLPALTRALGVLHERSTGLGGWTEVWRSLRLGGGYDYPTHYDGINNFLVHLSPTGAGASRTVNLWPPRFVQELDPDTPWSWSAATSAARDALSPLYRAATRAGDALYIPSYWFHNVSATGWSASANLYVSNEGEDEATVFRTADAAAVRRAWGEWSRARHERRRLQEAGGGEKSV